jgi:hypothetical protein
MKLLSSLRLSGLARVLVTVVLLALSVAGGVSAAAPAQADDPPPYGALYQDAFYFGAIYANGPDAPLKSQRCYAGCHDYQRWKSVAKGRSASGHSLIQLKSLLNGRCIDSNAAAAGGIAWLRGCNTGDYQIWEVFRDGDHFLFKSWGAWTQQGWHLCLKATGNPGTVKMAVCDPNNDGQRWG